MKFEKLFKENYMGIPPTPLSLCTLSDTYFLANVGCDLTNLNDIEESSLENQVSLATLETFAFPVYSALDYDKRIIQSCQWISLSCFNPKRTYTILRYTSNAYGKQLRNLEVMMQNLVGTLIGK